MSDQLNLYDNISGIASESSILKMNTYSIKRTLIFIAFLDFIFQIINGFSYALDHNNQNLYLSYTSFILATFILIGICGINRYNSCVSQMYGIYVAIKMITFLGIIFYYKLSFFGFIFVLLVIILNIWILKLLCKFFKNLNNLSTQDIESLKSGWKPNIHNIILI